MSRPTSIPARKWQIAETMPPTLRQQASGLNSILLQILYNRKLVQPGQIQAFLDGHYLESDDPFLLPDMARAVQRIEQAIQRDETIVVYGDFDADGVTATVLLVEALRGLGISRSKAQPYIPDRVDEGYGLNTDALDRIRSKGGDLVISVDCGIRSVAEVQHATGIGLDMIVTDHHSLGRHLPPAHAVINPKRPDSAYPERMLAGVGIAYKLAQALVSAMPQRARFSPEQLLDLVAIGTVADIAPLIGENRKLVTDGLRILNEARRPGIAALAQVSRLRVGQITAEGIGFGLGPRINAAGRLAHAYTAAKLLAAQDVFEASRQAQELNALNIKRQQLTRSLSEHAETLIEPDAPILIAADAEFVSGVVGLVASRLAEHYYRPAIVMEQGREESRGSCRSIPEFHITHALDQVADLLERHGGHAQAAGFTLKNERIGLFRERLTEIASSELEGQELMPTIPVDAELRLHEIDFALHGQLQQLEPTGHQNETPVFVSRRLQVHDARSVGNDNAHLKLVVGDGYCQLDAIAFRQGAWISSMPPAIDLLYTIDKNEWNGNTSLQLKVLDICPAEGEGVARVVQNAELGKGA